MEINLKCPDEVVPVFEKAQQLMNKYFEKFDLNPSKGTLNISDERYVFIRGASLSVHLFKFFKDAYPALSEKEGNDVAGRVLYDLAKSLGKADARAFFEKYKVETPMERLSLGPIHFAHTGWAYVDLSKECNPDPNNFCFVYDHHNSFEAYEWLKHGKTVSFCTCFLNAGYSAGRCTEAFGLALETEEIFCQARGDKTCRFVMAKSDKLAMRADEYRIKYYEK